MTAAALLDALYVVYLLLIVVLVFWRGPAPRLRGLHPPVPLAPTPAPPEVDADALATGLAGGAAVLQVEGWDAVVRRDPATLSVRYEVTIPGAVGAFQVAAPSSDEVLDAIDGAPANHVLFDGDLRVDGDPRRLAAQGGVLLALRDLVRRPGVVSARLAGGVLVVQEGPSLRVDLDLVVGTLQQAVVVARGCERRVLEVRVRGALVQGLAWTGGAAARCPYCHDGLDGELATCEACRTIHHSDCLADAGGCTVLGCRGRSVPA